MRKFERFAVSFFSAVLLATSVHAADPHADLRVIKEPAQIDAVFPKKATLRVVNFWATWCGPCVAEMPDLKAMDEMFGDEIVFVGVSMDYQVPGITKEQVAAFLDKQKIEYVNVFYTGSADSLGDHFSFGGALPSTIVFDRSGREVWRHDGRLDRNQTIAQLRELLRRHS